MPLRTSAVAPVSPFSDTRERDGQWLLIAGGVLLGSIGVFVEEAAQHPLVTVWFRCALGTLALLAWCLAAGRGRELWLSGRARWVACATGVLMCLGGSLCYAAVTLLANAQKNLAQQAISPFAMALWQCLVGTAALAWAPMVLGWPQQGAAWGWLLGLGVLHTGLAYVLLFAGMARLGLGRIAVLQFVYPLTAVLMDWVVYGRVLSPVQLAGVALMAAALWTLRRPAVRAAGG